MARFSKWYLIVRYLGMGWILFRLRHAVRMKLGYFSRRGPVKSWEEIEAVCEPKLLIDSVEKPLVGTIVVDANRIVAGEMRLFFNRWVSVGGRPDWHRNPLTGENAPRGVHWSRLGDFSFGDIKAIWELSRFGWAFTLAQAYRLTRDEKYAGRFWELFEDWLSTNPPNEGVNWKCGQECALRLMAVCYAGNLLHDSASSTLERRHKICQLAAATAERIELNLDYALSQKNNHGVSECVGLVTAACVLADDPRSKFWMAAGMHHLQRQLEELLYPDGGFSQHSVNYHRVVLDNLIWLGTILTTTGTGMPDWLRAAGERATRWLALLTDSSTGIVPCFGSNDGAWILPLGSGGYSDYRPTVQCGARLFCGCAVYTDASSDSYCDWLGIPREAADPTPGQSLVVDGLSLLQDSGLGVIRQDGVLCVLRSMPRYRHRMGHVDMLHVSLIVDGKAIILDPGSYSYNPPADRSTYPPLSSACFHNGPRLEGVEPVRKVSRFLSLPWPKGELIGREDNQLIGSHDGYWKVGELLGRTVVAGDNSIQIADATSGDMNKVLAWYWLFPNLPYEVNHDKQWLRLEVGDRMIEFAWDVKECESSIVIGDESSYDGWCSPHYQQLEKAIGLRIKGKGPAGFRLTVGDARAHGGSGRP